MITTNLNDAKTRLSTYVEKVEAGETVVICKRNVPVAELRGLPAPRKSHRQIGLAKTSFNVPATFFEPLPEPVLQEFSAA